MATRTWSELADVVKQRRNALGLTQDDVANRANTRMGNQVLSVATIRIIEAAKREDYRPRTTIGLARALDWPDNAIDRLRAGDDPDDLEPPPPADGAAAMPDEVLIAARIGKLNEQQRQVVLAMIDQLEPEG